MAVSRAPKRTPAPATPEVPEDKVQEIIRRGGSVAADLDSSQEQVNSTQEAAEGQFITDELKNVQLRLYESILQEIDQLRRAHARGRRPISRHSWLLEAIEEKLEKERRKRR